MDKQALYTVMIMLLVGYLSFTEHRHLYEIQDDFKNQVIAKDHKIDSLETKLDYYQGQYNLNPKSKWKGRK